MQAEVDNLTFEEWWAELSDAVRAWLLRRRVPPHLVDDIVQETGLRLFKMWDEIDAMRSPRGLAFTIASNLLWDERNRRSAREIVGDVPEQSCDDDVERAGIARIELARVRRAMSRLNPQQRSVLLAEIGDETIPTGSPAAVKMMRMRARRRLHAILDSAPAGAILPLLTLKQWWRAMRLARRGSALNLPTAAIVAACTTIAMVGIPATQPALGDDVETAVARARSPRTGASLAISAVDKAQPVQKATRSTRTTEALGSSDLAHGAPVHVEFGEGTPVRGEGDVAVEPAESFEIDVRDCYAEPTSTTEVKVHCQAQAGDKEVTADFSVGVEP